MKKAVKKAVKKATKPRKKPFRLESGKRYESEKGPITGILKKDEDGEFCERGMNGGVWNKNGTPYFEVGNTASKYGRLVREVKRGGKSK